MPIAPLTRAFLGTLNNYTDEDVDALKEYAEAHTKYAVIGFETCPTTGTLHLHTVMQLKRQIRITAVTKLVKPRVMNCQVNLRCTDPAHPKFAPDYCKKGELSKSDWSVNGRDDPSFGLNADFWEHGAWVTHGQRTDLEELRDAVDDAPNFGAVIRNRDLAPVLSRNLNFARELFNAKIPKPMENFEPRDWQADIIEIIESDPDDRTIHWVYDPLGAQGKTTLTNFLIRNHGAVVLSGKATDMFHGYDMQPIILVDIPRSTPDEYINYGAIEKLKDGVFFSGKYSSAMRVRDDDAHVIVFSNNRPETGKWTEDRLNLIQISDEPVPWDLANQFWDPVPVSRQPASRV